MDKSSVSQEPAWINIEDEDRIKNHAKILVQEGFFSAFQGSIQESANSRYLSERQIRIISNFHKKLGRLVDGLEGLAHGTKEREFAQRHEKDPSAVSKR